MKDIVNDCWKSLTAAAERNKKAVLHTTEPGQTPNNAAAYKNLLTDRIAKNGDYLNASEKFNKVKEIEAGLRKLNTGNYQKGTASKYLEREMHELFKKNSEDIQHRMTEIVAKVTKAETDYNVKYSINPYQKAIDLQRLQANIELMDGQQAAAKIVQIIGGQSYDSEIELAALLKKVPADDVDSFRKQLQDLNPPWIDKDLEKDLIELETLANIPPDQIAHVVDGTVTAISITSILDNVTLPDLDDSGVL